MEYGFSMVYTSPYSALCRTNMLSAEWDRTTNITFRYPPRVLEHATRQLRAISSLNISVEVSFDIKLNARNRYQCGDLYRSIDDVLAGDILTFSRRIFLHKTIHPFLFPKLYKIGALKVLEDSREEKYVQATSTQTLKLNDTRLLQRMYTDS